MKRHFSYEGNEQRHEKQRSFLFSRVDLLNRTDPGEAVRNVEYML